MPYICSLRPTAVRALILDEHPSERFSFASRESEMVREISLIPELPHGRLLLHLVQLATSLWRGHPTSAANHAT
jgi:hypothetical protein